MWGNFSGREHANDFLLFRSWWRFYFNGISEHIKEFLYFLHTQVNYSWIVAFHEKNHFDFIFLLNEFEYLLAFGGEVVV